MHEKIESLLKDEILKSWNDNVTRTIMWQWYFVAAIYSPIFTEAKLRFKKLMKDKVIYYDGLTPWDLNQKLSKFTKPNYFFENDLTK